MWLRRAQQSSSAGFWRACRSSVTEITGRRITMSIANAAICVPMLTRLWGACLSHSLTSTAASNAQTRLSANSICIPDSTLDVFQRCGDTQSSRLTRIFCRSGLTGAQNHLMMEKLDEAIGVPPRADANTVQNGRHNLVAHSFNGRTAASGAAYWGSNPWWAAK